MYVLSPSQVVGEFMSELTVIVSYFVGSSRVHYGMKAIPINIIIVKMGILYGFISNKF